MRTDDPLDACDVDAHDEKCRGVIDCPNCEGQNWCDEPECFSCGGRLDYFEQPRIVGGEESGN